MNMPYPILYTDINVLQARAGFDVMEQISILFTFTFIAFGRCPSVNKFKITAPLGLGVKTTINLKLELAVVIIGKQIEKERSKFYIF